MNGLSVPCSLKTSNCADVSCFRHSSLVFDTGNSFGAFFIVLEATTTSSVRLDAADPIRTESSDECVGMDDVRYNPKGKVVVWVPLIKITSHGLIFILHIRHASRK